MIPQITRRNIGQVTLIDLKGSLAGQWVSRGSAQFEKASCGLKGNKVIVNLKRISDMDTLGMKRLLDLTSRLERVGIIPGNEAVMDLFHKYPETSRFELIRDEHELAERYGNDLVSSDNVADKRNQERFQTVLGIKFQFYHGEEQIECIGVVSNLSENGFYIQYIDTNTIEHSLQVSDPSVIRDITFQISLPTGRSLQGRGQVVHRQFEEDQLGLGVKIAKLQAAHGIILHRYLSQQMEHQNVRKAGD